MRYEQANKQASELLKKDLDTIASWYKKDGTMKSERQIRRIEKATKEAEQRAMLRRLDLLAEEDT